MTMESVERNVTPASLVVIPLPKWKQRLAAATLLLIVGLAAFSMARNENFRWPVVWQFLFERSILNGVLTTLYLTAAAMFIGVVLGTVLAVMNTSANKVLRSVANCYIWVFRGTPLLVQLIFWYNLAALYPVLSLGLPVGPSLFQIETNSVVTVYVAAILGLGLNEAAYMSEIVRAGLKSVNPGQVRAAQALGMTAGQILRLITLPQAMRMIVPPTGNQFIGMLKGSALVSVISMPDLLYSAQLIYTTNFMPIPLLLVTCVWYLVLTSLFSFIQERIETYYSRGH